MHQVFLPLLCATAGAELLSSRLTWASVLCASVRPSVRPSIKPIFSEPVKQINAKFGRKVPFHHISRPVFSVFKILHLWFFTLFFFSFSLTWDHIAEKNVWKYTTDLLQKIIHTPKKGLYQNCRSLTAPSDFIWGDPKRSAFGFFFFFFWGGDV